MIIRAVIAGALIFFGVTASCYAGAKIIFPPNKALLTGKGSIEILGFRSTGDAAAAFLVLTGDGMETQHPVAEGVFRIPVTLAAGANVIVLGKDHITVFLDGVKASEAGFEIPDTHAVDNGCEDCHLIEKTAIKLLAEKGALCANCHDDVVKGPEGKPQTVVHPPVEEGDCLACHKFHGAAIKRLSPAGKRALCFECHDDLTAKKDGKTPIIHKPVVLGDCTGCHNPHAAASPKLLVAQGQELCRKCHKDPSRTPGGAEWKVPHPALDEGCQVCHQVHIATVPRLLKKAQAGLCFDCHDDFLKVPEGKKMEIHPPAGDGECASCHKPHGSAEKKLLTAAGKELCLGCHDDPAKDSKGEEWPVLHPALDEGCTSCHRPHVSEAPKLLAKDQAALCGGCHEDKNLDSEGTEWAAPHTPVRSGMCSSCHGSHGAPAKGLLRQPVIETCKSCHLDIHPKHLLVPLDPTGKPETTKATLPDKYPVRRKDGAMVCTGCHQPHGSNYDDLWPKDETIFCIQCHKL